MKLLFLISLILSIFIVSAVDTPYTPEIITVRGMTTLPVNFFNSYEGQTYTANLERNSPAVRLESDSIFVQKESFGSFNLIIGENELEKGLYFDKLIISNNAGVFQTIPIIIGSESKISEIEYDVSINFDPNSDISVISGETIISPSVNVYKLNFNNPDSNSVALNFAVYSIDGQLLSEDDDVVSVSRQASFEHFFNLGVSPPNEILIVVSAKKGDSLGLDLYQVSISNNPLFSPPLTNDYSPMIYMSIFIFLLSFIILISYLWYNHSAKQAKDWKSEIDNLKKTHFSNAAKGLRRLRAQRDVLERAYAMHYITKESFDSAILDINKMSNKLKKRL